MRIGTPALLVALVALPVLAGSLGDQPFLRADADGSAVVDVSDPQFTLDYLFDGGPPPDCMDAADANADAVVDQGDVVYTLSWLFSGGPPPPAPGPYACSKHQLILGCGDPVCP